MCGVTSLPTGRNEQQFKAEIINQLAKKKIMFLCPFSRKVNSNRVPFLLKFAASLQSSLAAYVP